LHGVVFDIFGESRGDPARRHLPEGGVGFFRPLLEAGRQALRDQTASNSAGKVQWAESEFDRKGLRD
jgi:hypothetical protein